MKDFSDMGEAAKWLTARIKSSGMSVTDACERAQIPRGSFYLLPRKGTSVNPQQLAALADILALTGDEEAAVFRAWFRARVASSALSGPFRIALKVIDKLPAKRRRSTYRAMIDAYEGRSKDRPAN